MLLRQARGTRLCRARARTRALRSRPLSSRVAARSQQQIQSGGYCQPPSAPLPLPSRLQRQTLRLRFSFALLHAVEGQLLKCVVVQHGASSFRVSRGLWDAWCSRGPRRGSLDEVARHAFDATAACRLWKRENPWTLLSAACVPARCAHGSRASRRRARGGSRRCARRGRAAQRSHGGAQWWPSTVRAVLRRSAAEL